MYLYAKRFGSKILTITNNNGQKIIDKVDYKPSLFIHSNKASKYKDIYGNSCEKISFESMWEAKEFTDKYKDVDNFEVLGNQKYEYCYLSDTFPGEISYNEKDIRIMYFDIEVMSKDGFPKPEFANHEVVSVAIYFREKYYVLGLKDYTCGDLDVKYRKCSSEKELLQRFLILWHKIDPDIISAYNSFNFDIPYLYNRITKVLGEDAANSLSPFNMVHPSTMKIKNKHIEGYDIVGVSHLDYYLLYDKFSMGELESNSLNHVAHVELGEEKINYSEYHSLLDLYENDYNKFIKYNIKDVELLVKLEKKKGFISQAIGVAYHAKVNFIDVFWQTRLWDAIIFNYLRERNVVIPQQRDSVKIPYEGAYVKVPQKGYYNWVISKDLTSEYPMCIIMFNISPETMLPHLKQQVSVDNIISENYDKDFLLENDVTLTGDGHVFTKKKRGFLPTIIDGMFKERKFAKDKMLEAEYKIELINREKNSRKIGKGYGYLSSK